MKLNSPSIMSSPKPPSLAGFDPFLPGPTTPPMKKKRDVKPPVPESPRLVLLDERNDNSHHQAAISTVRLEQLQKELRAIASQLERDSPRRNVSNPPSPEQKLRKASPKGNGLFSPLTKKLGHHHHCRAGSLDANKRLWREVQEQQQQQQKAAARPFTIRTRSVTANATFFSGHHHAATTTTTPTSSTSPSPAADTAILQEVWMRQQQEQQQQSKESTTQSNKGLKSSSNTNNIRSPTTVTANNAAAVEKAMMLYIPSLAPRPRPTSFLTGRCQDDVVLRTSEHEATCWQLQIPDKKDFLVAAKVTQFLDTYHSKECLLNLQDLVSYSRFELAQFASGLKFCRAAAAADQHKIADCHRPIVESLLDCSDDIIQVRGHWHTAAKELKQRREVLILERQHQFLVVMRGTATEQQQQHRSHHHRGQSEKTVDLNHKEDDGQHHHEHHVSVLAEPFRALQEMEKQVFARLDELTEATPFCDVVFSGHAFGASMAILAAYLYAYTRSDQRVGALVTGSPKVGLANFRLSVHASPNLKVMRLEYGHCSPRGGATATQQACHVGHTIRLGHKQQDYSVKAYKFSTEPVDLVAGARSLLFKRERDVGDYVQALEASPTWVTDYYKEDGAGVRGKDNEARQMV